MKTSLITSAAVAAFPSHVFADSQDGEDLTMNDLHVHLTGSFTIQNAMEVSRQRKIKFGIVEHPAPEGKIRDDKALLNYIRELRDYPVFIGVQPIYLNWSKAFSNEVLKKLDYVLMDPQTIPQEDGTYLRIWQLDAYVDDEEAFMERYMNHCLNILNHEPISIFGWPLSLPSCIGRDYYKVWTPERNQALISAAKARNIAIEINDMARVPDEDFIRSAKAQGLKFSFGTDSRTPAGAGRLTYGKLIVKSCGLTLEDLFVPGMN